MCSSVLYALIKPLWPAAPCSHSHYPLFQITFIYTEALIITGQGAKNTFEKLRLDNVHVAVAYYITPFQ